ncbi:MAG: hypothetical protein HPY90_14985 [Syntrophothermus sp.]|uniref:hypothetical protein n=1 Tax=Syntrophothermus sp. TaxID=2736299 RepID=UPI0025800AF3|nr:hypothetical protein [Syntrophothermus sp.]NSW84514.1 hypothetical protein [Syntrophothermus sp.]
MKVNADREQTALAKDFTEAFEELVYLRVEDVSLLANAEGLDRKRQDAYEELKEKLGQGDAYRLYSQIEETYNFEIAIVRGKAYKRGFFDGLRLVLMAMAASGE